MASITNEDRYAALEDQLKVAESALFGCRAMLNYVRRMGNEEVDESPRRAGLYPGQIDNYIESSGDTGGTEGEPECVE